MHSLWFVLEKGSMAAKVNTIVLCFMLGVHVLVYSIMLASKVTSSVSTERTRGLIMGSGLD